LTIPYCIGPTLDRLEGHKHNNLKGMKTTKSVECNNFNFQPAANNLSRAEELFTNTECQQGPDIGIWKNVDHAINSKGASGAIPTSPCVMYY
jgi:hypothetical protein